MSVEEQGPAGTTAYRRLWEPVYRGALVDRYDELRPRPPAALLELLVARTSAPPALVIDLGAGTGLPAAPWSAYA